MRNEVPGHAPKITKLEALELHTSRGGFELVERNISAEPMDIVVVELLNPAPAAFDSAMGGPQYRDALYSDLFQVPGMETDGKPDADLHLRAGEARWLPSGGSETIINSGKAAGNLITFEFN